ncbi:3'-5' exonuclease [Roseisolibacter agri]|uniref:DNA polymerase III subunit epsilon n=1 Tax=Roseisolibacter agri TaxID=2014610 RepID=A0AA37QFM5_9BACT|nr:3'-5' exonuclease [Roseisolibacter agri]GLC25515.1 DNA polymerase III subunit epsilon [Roseisolibacter agri]
MPTADRLPTADAWGFVPGAADGVAQTTAHAETERRLIDALTASGRYQVIEKLEPRPHYHAPDGTPTKQALFVDVETTGLGDDDRIIQLAMIPFEFAKDGRIFAVGACRNWYEDPGIPIPEEITALTGISQADVDGQRIPDAEVEAILADTALVLAHNARFDRPHLERRFPLFAEKHWACSCDDVPWRAEGLESSKLGWLAYRMCRMFYEAHRADADCLMAIHLLASRLPSGKLAMEVLLDCARAKTARIWACDSPFETKDVLKRRGYRWSGGENGRLKAWWRDVPEASLEAESKWLAEHVYGGQPKHRVQLVDAKLRYSTREPPAPPRPWTPRS